MPFETVTADPQELQKLAEAFDSAWVSVTSARLIDPNDIPAERERLSYIIMQIWRADRTAPLATRAVQWFLKAAAVGAPHAAMGGHPKGD